MIGYYRFLSSDATVLDSCDPVPVSSPGHKEPDNSAVMS